MLKHLATDLLSALRTRHSLAIEIIVLRPQIEILGKHKRLKSAFIAS